MLPALSGEFGQGGTEQLTYFQIQSRTMDPDLALYQNRNHLTCRVNYFTVKK
jgi:hypothetical protein